MARHHGRTAGRALAALALAGLAGAACGDDTATETTDATEAPEAPVIDPGDGGNYAPNLDPADFVAAVDNPYLPLTPGARWVYEGSSDGEPERIEVVVTDQRRAIMGISAVVVRDTVSVDGEVAEDTYDWFAQDRDGNVWYLGEDSREYEDGQVSSTEGSWEAGVDGALPGIVMPAHPVAGQAYRQEFYPGEAEDLAEVTELGATKAVGPQEYGDVLVIKEWNPLEPEVVEQKYYAPGLGMIAEETVAGGDDRAELIETGAQP
ncbi:MAG TPA: hypothetical protein VFM27_11470 [Acidimicrobiales bacterium]|nr:hypothetical protein [Acidimicrobiales bacterium]